MVARDGFEPPTSRLWAWQATPALPRDMGCSFKQPNNNSHIA